MMDGFTFGAIRAANRDIASLEQTIEEWARYAKKLERALAAQTVETLVHVTLKLRALEELQKLDPGNPMLDQAYRAQIGKQVEAEEARKAAAKAG